MPTEQTLIRIIDTDLPYGEEQRHALVFCLPPALLPRSEQLAGRLAHPSNRPLGTIHVASDPAGIRVFFDDTRPVSVEEYCRQIVEQINNQLGTRFTCNWPESRFIVPSYEQVPEMTFEKLMERQRLAFPYMRG